MIEKTTLPALNAVLNTGATLLILAGLWAVRSGRVELHKRLMLGAFAVSSLFLGGYLTHHAMHGSIKFTHEGWPRTLYFIVLATHVPLAAINLPMILTAVTLGLRGRIEAHRKVARWTWGVWLYVSVTGVVVYVMLYQLYPSAELGG